MRNHVYQLSADLNNECIVMWTVRIYDVPMGVNG